MDCDCHSITSLYLETSNDESIELVARGATDVIDFGKVFIGTSAHRTYKIKNDSQVTKEYLIQRNTDRNPLYQVFDFRFNAKVEKGNHLECKITYKPLFPFEKSLDNLYIYEINAESSCVDHTVLLKGESAGPIVQSSLKYLNFYCNAAKRTDKHHVELQNVSDFEVKYQFDVNAENVDWFDVDTICGTIPARKSVYVTFSFVPKKYGIYSQKIVCLLLYHKPRVFYVFGMYTENEISCSEDVHLKRFQQDILYTSGFCAFFYDNLKIMETPPPFALSETALDFGSVVLDKNKTNSKTLVTCLTNHMNDEIKVVWQKDSSKIFDISPNSVLIPPKQSALFECHFTPKEADCLWGKITPANVYWKDDRKDLNDAYEYVNVPLTISLRLLGNSFPENKRWIPQINMPEKITLPPCTPNSVCHTTFLMQATGYLPVSFRFLPPKNSNFILEPMIGVVKKFQIVAMQLQTDPEDKKIYVERWNVELNGMKGKFLPIFINGYCEKPCVVVGNDNVVRFRPIYPGCREFLAVMLKNTSIHTLLYKFALEDQELLQIDHPNGSIIPHETIFLEWGLTGNLKTPPNKKILCELRPIENDVVCGEQLDLSVQIMAEHCYSQLCSIPKNWHIGEVQIGVQHTSKFYLFNFGESTIHYKLVLKKMKKKPKKDGAKSVTIIPTQGTVKPQEKDEIMICVKSHQVGNFNFQISYQTRLSKNSFEIVDRHKYYNIFDLGFVSVYPQIQIEDILDHNLGPLFSKTTLWDLFNIRRINHHLKTMIEGETRTVDISMPDFEVNDESFYVTLILRNVSNFNTNVKLKRNKICDCPLVEKSKGFTFRTNVYDCRHRDMFEMKLSDENFENDDCHKLMITVKYFKVGSTKMSYMMYFSDSRILIININFKTWSQKIEDLSSYQRNYSFNFKNVAICELDPCLQAFWFYNNSSSTIWYYLDKSQIHRTETQNAFPVIECLNPHGSLLPYSSAALLFKFKPIVAKKYKFTFNLVKGQQECKLNLIGNGVLHQKYSIEKSPFTSMRHNFCPESAIEFSEHHIILKPFTTWCTREIMIFIRNLSKDRIIGYSFQRCFVEGIVDVEALNKKGVLDAKESHPIIIRIKSFDQGCNFKLQLPCKLLDHTQYFWHKTSAIAYNIRQEAIKDLFIITEDGISYPENDIIVESMPTNFFKTLSLQVNIISLKDVDLYIAGDKQLMQSPQLKIKLNSKKILKSIPTSKELVEFPIRSFITDAMSKEHTKDEDCFNVIVKQPISQNKQFVKISLECCIGNVLYCTIFEKTLERSRQLDPPYYIQFKTENFKNYHTGKNDAQIYLKNIIDVPQAPLIASIFRELIGDSIREIFHLGPQVKKGVKLNTIYNKKFQSKYTCIAKKCKCDK